jgi:predicted nucleic acid-binding protein
MKAFLDTSVLVATFCGEHEQHEASFQLFVRHKKTTACTAAHYLAEVYSVLTGMRGKDRASPDEALLFLGNVVERLAIVALNEGEYFRVIEEAAGNGMCGGAIFDAVIARCAVKAKAEAIYTWDLKHFNRLDENVASRARTPSTARSAPPPM